MLFENHQSPWLDEELRILQKAVRKFYHKEFVPLNEKWIDQGIVDRDAWSKAGKAGLSCAEIPTEYGGAGGDYRHETVIIEEMLRAGISGFGNQVHNSIVAPYLFNYGNEEQKQRWLPKMASGEMVGAIAMTEPDTGSDLQNIRTTAIRDGDDYLITVRKPTSATVSMQTSSSLWQNPIRQKARKASPWSRWKPKAIQALNEVGI